MLFQHKCKPRALGFLQSRFVRTEIRMDDGVRRRNRSSPQTKQNHLWAADMSLLCHG